jgi:hypothetical protein
VISVSLLIKIKGDTVEVRIRVYYHSIMNGSFVEFLMTTSSTLFYPLTTLVPIPLKFLNEYEESDGSEFQSTI